MEKQRNDGEAEQNRAQAGDGNRPAADAFASGEGDVMAKLSSFLGIILSMDKEDQVRHKGAHVHAWYSGHIASFDAKTGKMLAKGKNGFPRKQAGWIKTWIEIHQDDLSASWEMLKRGINPPEIEPLVK